MIAEYMSLPSTSVPNGCAALGGATVFSRFCSNGLYGVMIGSKIARKISRPTMAVPTSASLLRRYRRQMSANWPGLPPPFRGRPSVGGGGSVLISSSVQSDPGVQERVEHVDDEAQQDVGEHT